MEMMMMMTRLLPFDQYNKVMKKYNTVKINIDCTVQNTINVCMCCLLLSIFFLYPRHCLYMYLSLAADWLKYSMMHPAF